MPATLSLTMIVKDEAATIGRVLSQAASVCTRGSARGDPAAVLQEIRAQSLALSH